MKKEIKYKDLKELKKIAKSHIKESKKVGSRYFIEYTSPKDGMPRHIYNHNEEEAYKDLLKLNGYKLNGKSK